jgi:hypothetical protein
MAIMMGMHKILCLFAKCIKEKSNGRTPNLV